MSLVLSCFFFLHSIISPFIYLFISFGKFSFAAKGHLYLFFIKLVCFCFAGLCLQRDGEFLWPCFLLCFSFFFQFNCKSVYLLLYFYKIVTAALRATPLWIYVHLSLFVSLSFLFILVWLESESEKNVKGNFQLS